MRQYIDVIQDNAGNALVGATLKVLNYPSGTNASIFSDNGLTPIATSTVTADITGAVSFFAADGDYILQFFVALTLYKQQSPVSIFDGAAQVTFTDTGAANAYAIADSALEKALRAGLRCVVKVTHTNTGASTLQYNGLAVKAIVYPGGAAISGNSLLINGIYEFEYDGTAWQVRGLQLPNFYGTSPQENAAVVTAVDTSYIWGSFHRYGAKGDNATDDSTAIRNALLTGHLCLGDGPQYTYLMNSVVQPANSVRIDLQGARLKPNGNTACITRNTPSATATTTVSSGATLGSRSVVVASATGLAVGQWQLITATDFPTHDLASYPTAWAKITNVSGTTITFDRPLPVTYSGTISYTAYAASLILDVFECKNGILDGSACTSNTATGQGLRVSGYAKVNLENLDCLNWANNGTNTSSLEIFTNVDLMVTKCRDIGGVSGTNIWDLQDLRTCIVDECVIDGSHFGVNLTRCELGVAMQCQLLGRRKQEADDSVSPVRSVRGIKFYGCAAAHAVGNECTDFESPLKAQACFHVMFDSNVVRNAGLSTFSGQVALNISSQINGVNMFGGSVTNNVVENCGGLGIGVESDPPGKFVISGNYVKQCVSIGIDCTVKDCVIANNIVENWDTDASGDAAIRSTALNATITGNRFTNSDATRTCLAVTLVSTGKYVVRDNTASTANPIGFTFENAGAAAITAAVTAVTVAHGLSATPAAEDLTFTPTNNPTNDPGNEWIDTIGAANFNLNCRAVPGASTATFRWKASIRQPFTAP